MNPWDDVSAEEETKIADIANSLYRRIQDETEKILKSQLQILGKNSDDSDKCTKRFYPMEDNALATYEIDGIKILGVKISDNRMSIEFDIPNIETRNRGEVQNV